jgi:demethylmenaquinone methyltransferase/2-methoxy-6-polyprenyl-1,4-benzoquinol methylase
MTPSTPTAAALETLPAPQRAEAVRTMFGDIAFRYDRANSLLSGGMHHLWRRKAVRTLASEPADRILDVCCGTGDLAFAVADALGPDGEVIATDFTPQMVAFANEKLARRPSRAGGLTFQQADATELPFEANWFDAATVSFGIRNVVPPAAGLAEMARVVRPGGRVLVVEFGQPDGFFFGPLFRVYSRFVMPLIGGLVTGHRAPYEYLPRTSASFPAGSAFVEELLEPAGLSLLHMAPLTHGIAWLYLAEVRT